LSDIDLQRRKQSAVLGAWLPPGHVTAAVGDWLDDPHSTRSALIAGGRFSRKPGRGRRGPREDLRRDNRIAARLGVLIAPKV